MVSCMDLLLISKRGAGPCSNGENTVMKKKKYDVNFPTDCGEYDSEMIHDAVCWFLARFNMQYNGGNSTFTESVGIEVSIKTYKQMQCWGQCYEWDIESSPTDYMIEVADGQSVRDMLATLFHECVHLWQWERGHWKGEGEREACQLQYELADEYWRCGNV